MIRAAVYGATGYGGLELLRLLAGHHPQVEVVQATSREPGRRVDEVHPGLRGVIGDLQFTASSPEALDPELDAVFLALPHHQSHKVMDAIIARCPKARIYDLAQDFRPGSGREEGWAYGQPEFFGESLRDARKVALPGCFATSILLATLPAIEAGAKLSMIIADSKTGSSGSGAHAKALTHHPLRVSTFKAYKVFSHQHEAEIKATWGRLGAAPAAFNFVPQSSPLVRGIYSCLYLLHGDDFQSDLAEIYRRRYESSSFVTVLDAPPNVATLRGTNGADLYVEDGDGVTLVICAIDNLVRGAAGQAIQSMNIGFGFEPERGLRLPALLP